MSFDPTLLHANYVATLGEDMLNEQNAITKRANSSQLTDNRRHRFEYQRLKQMTRYHPHWAWLPGKIQVDVSKQINIRSRYDGIKITIPQDALIFPSNPPPIIPSPQSVNRVKPASSLFS